MKPMILIGAAAALALTPIAAFADSSTNTPSDPSERAMAPTAPETGATADKTMTGRSAADPSERAMSPAAPLAGATQNKTAPAPVSK